MARLIGFIARLVTLSVLVVIVCMDGTAEAEFTFGTPIALEATINSGDNTCLECISTDGLELYLSKPANGNIGSMKWNLYVSTRTTVDDSWPVPVSLGPTVNSSSYDAYACLSDDDLELYFSSQRAGGYGRQDIWVTTRDSKGADWSTPVNLGPTINSPDYEMSPWITLDGLELYFNSSRPGGSDDIWVARRASRDDSWQTPVNLGQVVNSTGIDCYPCLSSDGLVLFFSDFDSPSGPYRSGGFGKSDMWMTRRRSTGSPWEIPVNLGFGMNTETWDAGPRVSSDGSVLYFNSARPGGPGGLYNVWQTPIIPIVDFDDDGAVDRVDIDIMVDYWGTDEPLCDIGPMPWGDGVVDVQDLIVLVEHIVEASGGADDVDDAE